MVSVRGDLRPISGESQGKAEGGRSREDAEKIPVEDPGGYGSGLKDL